VTLRQISTKLGIGYGVVRDVHDEPHYRKAFACWVPRITEELKAKRMMASLSTLQLYSKEGHPFINSTITGCKTWMHHLTLERKQSLMECKHSDSLMPKKFQLSPSTGKVLATVFWEMQGVPLAQCGRTINTDTYCATLQR
jgi:hypothetical protein